MRRPAFCKMVNFGSGRWNIMKLMRIILTLVLVIGLQSFLANSAFSANNHTNTSLNSQAVESNLSSVVIAASAGSAPFHFTDKTGLTAGMFVDLWRLWSKKTGVEITFKSAGWGDTLTMMRQAQADIHAGVFYNEARDAYLDYGPALYKSDTHFFFHKNISGLKTLEDLIGFKIGIIKGDFAVEYVQRRLPKATIALYSDNKALFDAVENGEILVFIKDTPIALYHLRLRNLLHQFRHHSRNPLYSNMFYAAVKEGDSRLLSTVNSGMEAITPQERAAILRKWVGVSDTKTRDVLTIALPYGHEPLSMRNFEGRPTGMFIDVWRLWSLKTGQKIEFRMSNWAESVNALKTGDVDIHSGLISTNERRTFLDFSQPFYQAPSAIFYRAHLGELTDIDNLSGYKVGTVKGSYQSQYLRAHFPNTREITFPDSEAMLYAAVDNQIHAFLSEAQTALGQMERLGERGKFKQLDGVLFTNKIHAAVKKGNTALLNLVDAGFNAIARRELAEIEKRWIASPEIRQISESDFDVRLSAAEQKWINQRKTIRLGVDPQWPPFDYLAEDGITHMGMASDYVRLLNKRLGLSMNVVPGLTWSQTMTGAKERTIDVVACLAETPQRKTFLNFTRPYISFPWVIIARRDYPLIGSVNDLYQSKVAVVQDYAVHQRLASNHPDIKLFLTQTPLDGLQAVSTGKVAAYMGNLAVTSYLIEKHHIANLKVAAPAGLTRGSDHLRFGIRSDWPELASIIDKGLASITPQERETIQQRWFSVRFEHGIDTAKLKKIALQAASVVIVILAVILFWNRKLKKEVIERQAAETALQRAHDELEHRVLERTAELAETNDSLRAEIAERIRAEEFWRRYDFIVNSSKDLNSLVNRQYTYKAVNDAYCQALSRNREEIIDRQVADIWGEAVFRDVIKGHLDRCFAGQEINYQEWFDIPFLEAQCFNVTYYPYRNHENNVTHAVVVSHNITELKIIEQALRESEQKYRNLVERANDGIVIIQDGLIKYVNPSGVKLSGGVIEEMLDKPFTNYIHPDEIDKLVKGYKLRMSGENIKTIFETIFKRNDGSYIYAEVNAGLITYQGKPADMVIIRDITERKQAQEALQRAHHELEIKVAERTAELAVAKERAEAADRLKSAFLAAMSHELRTPLNSIIGFTGIMLQGLVGPLNKEQTKQLGMVRDSSNHLLSLINDVLDISKIEAGQLDITIEVFDMRSAIDKVVNSVNPMAIKKGLRVATRVAPEVGQVKNDRRRVEQILINLLNNAVKFTQKGEVRLECKTDNGWLEISVVDSGIGIKAEDMQKLFVAFHQLETGLARRYEGTGLGLSICKKLVEMLGGKIWAESKGALKGSRFTFTLPLKLEK